MWKDSAAPPGPPQGNQTEIQIELRLRIPEVVADWFEREARLFLKQRNAYIRDLLIRHWRENNHDH